MPPESNHAASRHAPVRAAERLPVRQKLAYGLGALPDMWGHWLYPNLAYQVFNIFLGVAPWAVGLALFCNRLCDAVTDPLFGWWSDNTRSRWGRRRPYILVAGVAAGLALPLLVAVTPGWGATTVFGRPMSNYLWYMLASSVVFLPIMSAFKVPFDCLGAEMTPDYHERTSVWAYRNAIQKVAELALFFAAQFTTMAVWVGATAADLPVRVRRLVSDPAAWTAAPAGSLPNVLLGAQVYCAALGVLMALVAVVMAVMLRERYYAHVVSSRQPRIALRESLWQTLRCRPFRIQLLIKLPYAVGTSMVAALGFYDTVYYVCRGNLAAGAVWNFRMGVGAMLFGFCGVPAFALVGRLAGKRHAMMVAFAITIAVYAATWWLYNPTWPWLQVVASALIAFTSAGFAVMDGSMRADVLDFDELETGKRREGAFAACDSWLSKAAMAVGAGGSGLLLSCTGFDARLGGNQTELSITTIRVLLGLVPIVGTLLALGMARRFPLTPERMHEIRRQLEARRGRV